MCFTSKIIDLLLCNWFNQIHFIVALCNFYFKSCVVYIIFKNLIHRNLCDDYSFLEMYNVLMESPVSYQIIQFLIYIYIYIKMIINICHKLYFFF